MDKRADLGSTNSGVMGAIGVPLTAHCVVLCLLQMVALSSEQFTVNGLESPVLVPLGGNLELSCQLSPPQQAKHMEIRWFKNRYSEPVYLYRNGKDLPGEIVYKYVERTELLKDDIGKGKVTLRIFKVTSIDSGSYHCFFKDDKFYEEHIIDVKVTATSSDIQIFMHPPNITGVRLECHSGGWFPKPHMEWRDSKGEYIPATSKSNSQDENEFFNMTMDLFIKSNTHWTATCFIQNFVTRQEESISIVLPGVRDSWKPAWIMITLLIAIHMTYYIKLYPIYEIKEWLLERIQSRIQNSRMDQENKEQLLEYIQSRIQNSNVDEEKKEWLLECIKSRIQNSSVDQEKKEWLLKCIQSRIQNSSVDQETKMWLLESIQSSIQYSRVDLGTKKWLLESLLSSIKSSSVDLGTKKLLMESITSSIKSTTVDLGIKEWLLETIESSIQNSSVDLGTKELLLKIIQSSIGRFSMDPGIQELLLKIPLSSIQSSSVDLETKELLVKFFQSSIQSFDLIPEKMKLLVKIIQSRIQSSSVDLGTKNMLLEIIQSSIQNSNVYPESKELLLKIIQSSVQSSSVDRGTKEMLLKFIQSSIQNSSVDQSMVNEDLKIELKPMV